MRKKLIRLLRNIPGLRQIRQFIKERGKLRFKCQRLESQLEGEKERVRTLSNSERKYRNLHRIQQRKNEGLRRQLRDSRSQAKWIHHLDRIHRYKEIVLLLLDKEPVDLCLTHDSLALTAAQAVHDKTGCRMVFDGVEYPDYVGRSVNAARVFTEKLVATDLIQHIEKMTLKEMDAILVGTRGVAEVYGEDPALVPANIVRNCLDFEEIAADLRIREDCGLDPQDHLLLFPNTVYPQCGIEQVIEALLLLPSTFHLAIMGRIHLSLKDTVDEFVERADGRVHLLPLRPPKDLLQYRSGADFALVPLDPEIPNHRTCLPNRVFEAIMARLPLIATDLPYVRELIETYSCGCVLQSKNPGDIAATIMTAYEQLALLNKKTALAARALSWENEKEIFTTALGPVLAKTQGKNLLFLANKPIATNRRVFRHTRELADMGFDVTVMALDLPVSELRDSRIQYHDIDVGSLPKAQFPAH